MTALHQLQNVSRPRKARKVVGRGPGCRKGKTCGRGHKGASARAGYKRRWGYEGGQMRLFMKLPERGFSNVRFQKRFDIVNLKQIEDWYQDGETVNQETLEKHGLIRNRANGVKILGNGEITKKVTIDVDAISKSAREKLEKAEIVITKRESK